jgi:RNA polymerase sigma-70 factor (ECF subfamily)
MNAPHKTTEEIIHMIRAIRRGENVEENFHEIHELYYSAIYRFFLSKGMKPEDARDLTQNTFLSVFTSMGDLQQEAKFEGWLFSIALNAWRREWERANAGKRKGRPIAIVAEDETDESELSDTVADLASPGPDPQQAMLDKEKLALLHQALLELPEQRRRCTLLYVNSDLKYHQIADLLGISLNTVKAHLHKAKGDLRRKLGRYFGEIDF